MTIEDYNNIKEIHEKLTYWREVVDNLKKWQIEAYDCIYKPQTYQKTYPRQGLRLCFKKKKKDDSERSLSMNIQGRIGEMLLPLESIDALVKYAEEQLKIAEYNFNNIQIKAKDNGLE